MSTWYNDPVRPIDPNSTSGFTQEGESFEGRDLRMRRLKAQAEAMEMNNQQTEQGMRSNYDMNLMKMNQATENPFYFHNAPVETKYPNAEKALLEQSRAAMTSMLDSPHFTDNPDDKALLNETKSMYSDAAKSLRARIGASGGPTPGNRGGIEISFPGGNAPQQPNPQGMPQSPYGNVAPPQQMSMPSMSNYSGLMDVPFAVANVLGFQTPQIPQAQPMAPAAPAQAQATTGQKPLAGLPQPKKLRVKVNGQIVEMTPQELDQFRAQRAAGQ